MNWFRWQITYRPSRQHLTSMLLLAVIVASLLPIPLLPSFCDVVKDNSVPFPCQDRPCGCRSADQCLKKCCCFSTEQKLTWSKRYGAKEFPFSLLLANALSIALISKLSNQNELEEGMTVLKEKSKRLMHVLFPVSILFLLTSKWFYPLVFSIKYFLKTAYTLKFTINQHRYAVAG